MWVLRYILTIPSAIVSNLLGSYLYYFLYRIGAERYINPDSILNKIFYEWGVGVFSAFLGIFVAYKIVPKYKFQTVIFLGILFSFWYILNIYFAGVSRLDFYSTLGIVGGLIGSIVSTILLSIQVKYEERKLYGFQFNQNQSTQPEFYSKSEPANTSETKGTLEIQPTYNTPYVLFQPDGNLLIQGKSIPEDGSLFFDSLYDWVIDYKKEPANETTLTVFYEYCNEITPKLLLRILRDLQTNCPNFIVKWKFEEEDEDMFELGEMLRRVSECNFEFIEVY